MASTHNILYIHSQSDISGGERSLLNLWSHLNPDEFSLHVILPGEGPLSRQAALLGVKIHLYKFPKIHPVEMIPCIKAFMFLRIFIKHHQIALIHSYSPRNNVMGSLAGRSLNIPVIWHERNIPETNEKDITRQLIFLPDAVICNSQAVANRFSEDESLPSKVRVISNGVNVVVFDKKQRDVHLAETLGIDGKSVVGIFTNLSDRRRVEYFIEIAKMIHGQKPDTRFIIVGGEYSREATGREELLKGMAEKAGLKKIVCFTGFQEDVTPYLSLCDVVCHVTKQDACSRAVLEAMASSKAIVAINDGGNPELIDHSVNGLLIDADDKAGFVRSVIRLLEEPSLRESLGFAARQKARKSFDVAINAQKTIEIYRQLMSRG